MFPADLLLVVQIVKTLPAVQELQETLVQSPGREAPLEKERLPTPAFLPGESHGQRSLAGYSPWGRTELDMTELLTLYFALPLCATLL